MSLGSLLLSPTTTAAEVASYISELDVASRRKVCLGLTRREQKRLWELVSGAAGSGNLLPTIEDATAVFAGRNSLSAFSRFEKWFARPGSEIVGCNRHPLSALIGPGYFTVATLPDGTLTFDYARVPDHPPDGWPAVSPNSRGLAKSVYGGLVDRVEWVTPDVLVGAAYRDTAPLDSYFVLVREAFTEGSVN